MPLSKSTERAYRGEVDRLAQFFAVKHGGLMLSEFNEAHWDEYVDEVRGTRPHVVTCQEKPLAPASVEQAIRISAAFLRWARDDGLLSWAPKARRMHTGPSSEVQSLRGSLIGFSADEEPVHPDLYAALHNPLDKEAGLGLLRAHMAVLLAYWGGLGSSDIAALRCSDLLADTGALWLRHPRSKSVEEMQGDAVNTWLRYLDIRQENDVSLTRKSPAIARLGSDEPISSWSVWALIAQFVAQVTGQEQHHSAQSLRRLRIRQMASELEPSIDALAQYAQRGRVDFTVAGRMIV
ncbi:hypothetical protein INR38_12710 [Delftia sp. SD018]|uniref:hypothetical protein n=1 Tax=unclassified Delftia TaxID=2613839 RepID=UPI001A976D8D|nr:MULTISPECIES: hypothetical protein [unclassified Delftia]MBO0990752.1 hypothetical protein [Delftia sp. SD083]MBO1034944.1 hypothetical protein [Delftia sp. SD018]